MFRASYRSKCTQNKYETKCRRLRFTDIDFSDFSGFIFKVNHAFMEEGDNPSEKVVIDGEELYGIEIDIWHLKFRGST